MTSQLLLFPKRPTFTEGLTGHRSSRWGHPAPVIDMRQAVRLRRDQADTPSAGQAGRMVISGRMADVCAALDQLVAAG
jgi:hypothetical protein